MNAVIVALGNGLAPVWHQAITRKSADLKSVTLLITLLSGHHRDNIKCSVRLHSHKHHRSMFRDDTNENTFMFLQNNSGRSGFKQTDSDTLLACRSGCSIVTAFLVSFYKGFMIPSTQSCKIRVALMYNDNPNRLQLCTWHDSWAVVPCD